MIREFNRGNNNDAIVDKDIFILGAGGVTSSIIYNFYSLMRTDNIYLSKQN